jgi:hypothetical protein
MKAPDVNVLINAFRRDVSQHQVCRSWLDAVVLGQSTFAVSPLVLSAVVRVTTGASYPSRSSLEEAFGFCRDLIGQPNCRLIEPGERHWSIFERLCVETNTMGPRVTDAWFAALAIEHGCEWVTLDRDYARFPGLNWSTPG